MTEAIRGYSRRSFSKQGFALKGFAKRASIFTAGAILLAAPAVFGQTSSSSASTDKWLHVRVVNADDKSETVRVNIPLDLAEKVLPTINKDRLHNGKIKIDEERMHGDVDLHALMEAVRGAKDGEYVTVQGTENDVRVAKQGGHILVHVSDKTGHGMHHHRAKHHDGDKSGEQKDEAEAEQAKVNPSQVEIKIPMKVIDALLSAGKDELDIVAALHALAAQGDAELVSVKADDGATVRVWIDSKNVAN